MNDMTTQSTANPSALPEWVDRLFARFALMYGGAWADRWRDAPLDLVKDEWYRTLRVFDLPTMKRALDWCAANQKFPPSLPEFADACRNHRTAGSFVRLESKPGKQPIPPEAAAALRAFVESHKVA